MGHSNERQKMCHQCDGRIPFDANICLYCSSNQEIPMSEEDNQFYRQQSLQKSLTTLYSPPYPKKSAGYTGSDKEEGLSMKSSDPFKMSPLDKPMKTATPFATGSMAGGGVSEEATPDERASFWPIFLLSVGANLLLLGLLQLFFSTNGILRLEWESRHWFIYSLIGLPVLIFGYRKAKSLS